MEEVSGFSKSSSKIKLWRMSWRLDLPPASVERDLGLVSLFYCRLSSENFSRNFLKSFGGIGSLLLSYGLAAAVVVAVETLFGLEEEAGISLKGLSKRNRFV